MMFTRRFRIARFAPVCGVLLLCLASCSKKKSETPRESYKIEGTVQDQKTATPIAGVHVAIVASGASGNIISSNGGSASSDAEGHFSVVPYHYEGVTTYNLTFARDGYNDARSAVPANYFSSASHPNVYTLLQTMTKK